MNAIFINGTAAYCTNCGRTEFARIVADDGGVFMERMCDAQGVQRTRIAADYRWYMERMSAPQDFERHTGRKPPELGCPGDCGPCE